MSMFMHGPWIEVREPGGPWRLLEKLDHWPQDYTLYRHMGARGGPLVGYQRGAIPARGHPGDGQASPEWLAHLGPASAKFPGACVGIGWLSVTEVRAAERRMGRRRPNNLSDVAERMQRAIDAGLEARLSFCADI